MIAEAELRRLAAIAHVDLMVLDLDYSLSWFLAGLSTVPDASNILVFKGGTCLRKCYFNDYRFSEDLDFTAQTYVKPDQLQVWLEQVSHWSAERNGPNFNAAPMRVEIVADDYGRESIVVRVYYRGPLVWGGSPRAIQVDITRDEKLCQAPIARPIIHPFSDAQVLGAHPVYCYTLVEILAEKLRAIAGQRRFAISRDLYDICRLVQAGISFDAVTPLIAEKFMARGISVEAIDPEQLEIRKPDFERDWQLRLSYLVTAPHAVSFDDAWRISSELVKRLRIMNLRS